MTTTTGLTATRAAFSNEDGVVSVYEAISSGYGIKSIAAFNDLDYWRSGGEEAGTNSIPDSGDYSGHDNSTGPTADTKCDPMVDAEFGFDLCS